MTGISQDRLDRIGLRLRLPVSPALVAVLAFVAVVYGVLVWTGTKTFSSWSQVQVLWDSGRPVLELTQQFHFARFIIAYPGLALEAALPGRGFSIYIIGMILLSVLQFHRSHRLVTGRSPQVWVWLAFLPLFLLMNGRGAIGWAGWLTCLHAGLAWRCADPRPGLARSLLAVVIGLSLATVTSGMFIICVAFVLYCWFFPKRGGWRIRTKVKPDPLLPVMALVSVVFLVLLLVLAGEYLQDGVVKAVRFFGEGLDGVVGMLSHGLLSRIERFSYPQFVVIAVFGCANLVFLFSRHAKRVGMDLLVAFYLPAAGIAVGFTLATLALPVALIIAGKLVRFRIPSVIGP